LGDIDNALKRITLMFKIYVAASSRALEYQLFSGFS
jgi:hypothetical protein